jgi:hypothetical protein
VPPTLRKQISPHLRKLHVNSRSMDCQPTICNSPLQASAVFVRCTAGRQKRRLHFLDMNAAALTASLALAICNSLRAAASGSAKWLGLTNFIGSFLSISKDLEVPRYHGKTRDPSQACVDVRSD